MKVERSELAPMDAPSAAAQGPDLFAYQDYRKYLADWFRWKKSLLPHYSGALFAKKAGFSSHTLLGMVIRGQRNLSADSIRAFSRALALRAREAIFFEKLVFFNQAKNPEDRAYYLEQLVAATQGQGREVPAWAQSDASLSNQSWVIAAKDYPRLAKRIQEFSAELHQEFSAEAEAADQVVAVSLQFFPVTESESSQAVTAPA